MKLQEVIDFVQESLEAGLTEETEKAAVEQPAELEGYVLKHPFAAYLVLLNKDDFSDSESAGAVVQRRDIYVSVVIVVRAVNGKMTPAEHIDRVYDVLSGIRIESPRGDAYMRGVGSKFLQEENGIWYYEVLIKVPEFFVEKQYRNS